MMHHILWYFAKYQLYCCRLWCFHWSSDQLCSKNHGDVCSSLYCCSDTINIEAPIWSPVNSTAWAYSCSATSAHLLSISGIYWPQEENEPYVFPPSLLLLTTNYGLPMQLSQVDVLTYGASSCTAGTFYILIIIFPLCLKKLWIFHPNTSWNLGDHIC
jgi:hypothetical protein